MNGRHAVELDPLDAEILKLLREDARLSYRKLAERTGSTTPTVSARVKNLEDLGIIRGYEARVDPDALGGALHVARVTAPPGALARVADALAAVAGVEEVLTLAGDEVLARYRVRPPAQSVDAFHAALAALPDVTRYVLTPVVRATRGQAPAAGADAARVDVTCHECHGPVHGAGVHARFGERGHVFCCRNCLGAFRGRWEKASAGAR